SQRSVAPVPADAVTAGRAIGRPAAGAVCAAGQGRHVLSAHGAPDAAWTRRRGPRPVRLPPVERPHVVRSPLMVFTSLHFVAFFAVVYALYRVLPHRAQNVMLLGASYYFYGSWDWRFLSLLIGSTVIDFH